MWPGGEPSRTKDEMYATYTKLNDGSWGLRVSCGPVAPYATVTVTKKSGETKVETVGQVLWTGNGVSWDGGDFEAGMAKVEAL